MRPHGLDIRLGGNLIVMGVTSNLGDRTVDIGPDELLLASLGACTSVTLKNYAKQRGWVMSALDVDLCLDRRGVTASIERILAMAGELDQNQREQLLEVAEHTPVTLLIKSGLPIKTEPA
jgi:putative redox protein